jgi:hypothetical protein
LSEVHERQAGRQFVAGKKDTAASFWRTAQQKETNFHAKP